jgi:outer membrane immunogenic protein
MPLKAPPPPVVFGWTGFYAGGNVGLSVARDRTAAPVLDPFSPTGIASNEQANLSPFGVIGGGQIGYNFQADRNWVLGIETDFQGSGERDNRTCIDFCNVTPFGEKLTQSIDWFGTVRGRVGWTNGPALFYVTGGGAYAKVSTALTFVSNGAGTFSGAFGSIKTGWTAGAGVEAHLFGNWTAKAEYLYMDLGTVSGSVPTSFGVPFTFTGKVQDHIGRVGVNYKFGDPVYMPAAASGAMHYKAAPVPVAANWSGFYLGGNVGGSVARSPSWETQTDPALGTLSHDSFYADPIGVIGGVQAGYNLQAAPQWVLGVEVDIQASGERDSTTCIFACSSNPPPFVSINETIRENIDWFGTVRGRAGWTNGPTMFYATGGLAYGRVRADLNTLWTNNAGLSAAANGSVSTIRTGWTAGGGVESKLVGNWSVKAEYLFLDLGTIQGSAVSAGNFALQVGRTFAFSSHVQDHIFRAGLNYNFNPVAALR